MLEFPPCPCAPGAVVQLLTRDEKSARASALNNICKARGVPAAIARALGVGDAQVLRLRRGEAQLRDDLVALLPAALRVRFEAALARPLQLLLPFPTAPTPETHR